VAGPDEQSSERSQIAELVRVFVLDHFGAEKLRAVLGEPSERVVEVVHGEHDANRESSSRLWATGDRIIVTSTRSSPSPTDDARVIHSLNRHVPNLAARRNLAPRDPLHGLHP
jgi:hypothetical protein